MLTLYNCLLCCSGKSGDVVKETVKKKSVIIQKSAAKEEFSVEGIVDGPRLNDGKFLIKWTGFASSENTWEPRSHFSAKLLREYERKKAEPKAVGAPPGTFASIAAAAVGTNEPSVGKPRPAISKPNRKGQTSSTSPSSDSAVAKQTPLAASVPSPKTKVAASSLASPSPKSSKKAAEADPSPSPQSCKHGVALEGRVRRKAVFEARIASEKRRRSKQAMSSSDSDEDPRDAWRPPKTVHEVASDSCDTEPYPGRSPPVRRRVALTSTKTTADDVPVATIVQTAVAVPATIVETDVPVAIIATKKVVTPARVLMQRSDSVESYFSPEGHQRGVVAVPDVLVQSSSVDSTQPRNEGYLDVADRRDASDLSWTMIDPKHHLTKKKREKGKNESGEFGVWPHVGFVRTDLLNGKYKRKFFTRPWVHGCIHCGKLIATGWSKMIGPIGSKVPDPTKGAWQSSKVLDHLRLCELLPADYASKIREKDGKTAVVKEEEGINVAATTPMPLKMQDGEVVFSSTLTPDTTVAARVAIARCIMYSKTRLPDTIVECPWEREKLRLVFKAGFEAAQNGKSSEDYPFLCAKNIADYVDNETKVMLAYGKHWANTMSNASSGNPHSQVQSDIVTLADRMPRQSIGHFGVCPRTNKELVINTGFKQVHDKTNAVCAADMEAQCLKFFGKKQLHVAHSIVTDVAAYNLGTTLEGSYDGAYTIRRDKCMMHQTGKLCTFGMGAYSYKDGRGNDAFPCPQLKSFNIDFANLEKMYRTKQNSRDLSAAAKTHGGCATLRFRSNFNTTRAAGSMHQHTVALRLKRVIGYFELENPDKVTHEFTGQRWTELAEIQAIESVSGGLTMRCQEEQKATAGYWYKWLDEAFSKLSGKIAFKIIDTNHVTASPHLPYIDRPLVDFKSLSHIVRGRHMVEFKRRYGLEGLSNGLDVNSDWKPTMTMAWGLPILMDPRLCCIPSKMGLLSPQLDDYKSELHEIHYEWYVRARSNDMQNARACYDAELQRRSAEIERRAMRDSSLYPERLNTPCVATNAAQRPDYTNLGFESDSEDEVQVDYSAPVEPGPPIVPLISKPDFFDLSRKQYKRYKNATKELAWKDMYPDPKYKIGVEGAEWQELLYGVDLLPVWKALDALNHDDQFGFFVTMARHSRASVYKLQASSFCERVNSAGKIVFSDSNLSLSTEKVEQRTMLRMNRKWMVHMRKHYQDCTAELMLLLRDSHNALRPILDEHVNYPI